MFGGWFRSIFGEWRNLTWATRCIVDSLLAPLERGAFSPGEKASANHMLSRLIRKSDVIVGGKALPPHDMPMARYQTSRLRRSPRSLHNSMPVGAIRI